jgi:hypothetical protein
MIGIFERTPHAPLSLLGSAILLCLPAANATQVASFSTSFSASQSVFSGGDSAGFDVSDTFGSNVGIEYRVAADTGTVNASASGQVQATYQNEINANTATSIGLEFLGGSSSVSSALGASANVTGFIDVCVIPNPFGGCIARIDTDFDFLDAGLFLDPSKGFTADLGRSNSASAADSAIGFGPNLDLIIGELGAEVNLDIDQQITLTLDKISGVLSYTNRRTDETLLTPFTIGSSDSTDILTQSLSAGIWDFSVLDLSLDSDFRNDVDLEIRPTINYIIGEWPEPGDGLISIGLVDETFSLDFNEVSAAQLFSITVVPVPGGVMLFASALAGLGFVRTPRRRA